MAEDDQGRTVNERDGSQGEADQERSSRSLVRLLKPVIIGPRRGGKIDSSEVLPRFYNSFHFLLLSKDRPDVTMAIGITSANQGEGKTLVASNLAVSLAVANQRETVLVDLNIRAARLHRIFGVDLRPGLVDALVGPTIQLSQTQIDKLFVLSAGDFSGSPPDLQQAPILEADTSGSADGSAIGLQHIAAFRDVLYSLKEEFEFVIIDMPAMQEPHVPVLWPTRWMAYLW